MVCVPNICTDTAALRTNPIIAYLSDGFRKPTPFSPDVVIDIDDVVEKKLDMLHCHTSQMYEWLPWIAGNLEEVPESNADRRKWLEHRLGRFMNVADQYRDKLVELYGKERGRQVKFAEGFEGCEYGGTLNGNAIGRLFPFFEA
jgi:LmbE family N-acetylglucosaminyl deacetylase